MMMMIRWPLIYVDIFKHLLLWWVAYFQRNSDWQAMYENIEIRKNRFHNSNSKKYLFLIICSPNEDEAFLYGVRREHHKQYTYSLTYSLTHGLMHSCTLSLSHSLAVIHTLAHSFTQSHSHTLSLARSLTLCEKHTGFDFETFASPAGLL